MVGFVVYLAVTAMAGGVFDVFDVFLKKRSKCGQKNTVSVVVWWCLITEKSFFKITRTYVLAPIIVTAAKK